MPQNIKTYSLFKSLFLFLALLLFAGSTYLLIPEKTHAQGVGLSIKPATIEESLDPGEEREYRITVQNLNEQDQEYYVFSKNVSGVSGGGAPVFAEIGEKTGYELADWISLPYSQVLIPGKGSVQINFKMSIPEDASPGSHFGGVFISAEPPKIERSGAAVGYQVGNIISIRVSGDVVEKGSIRQFSTSKPLYSTQDVDFNVRIENAGNVLIRPVGPLEIFNMLGNKVGTVMFNEDAASVFPYSTREFTNLNWTGTSLGFGRYEAILSPGYGDDGAKKTMSSTVTFWILPMNIILPALAVLGFLLLVVFISVKLYVRRSLQHLQHERRLVRRRRSKGSSGLLLITVVMLTVTALFLIVLLALFA